LRRAIRIWAAYGERRARGVLATDLTHITSVAYEVGVGDPVSRQTFNCRPPIAEGFLVLSNPHDIGELDITPSLWFFHCHFPGDPVMPGCLGLDAMWQMIGYWLGWSGSPGKGRAAGVGEVKFRGHITPEVKRVRYEVDMRQVRRGKLVLGIADGRVLADDTCVYVARDMRVALIEAAI
jgi:3-hydroxymyristoyl/3-hydroxydecanoyl-(acyl carrier protein) dehydratase